jgi:hypothetical protein
VTNVLTPARQQIAETRRERNSKTPPESMSHIRNPLRRGFLKKYRQKKYHPFAESFFRFPPSSPTGERPHNKIWRSKMLYVKNVPGWERAARAAMGVGLVAAAVVHFGPTPLGWGVGAMGAMAAMTGLIGFCPACAMVGRKLGK